MTTALKRISPLLQVKDLEASVGFYTGKLGFREAWRDEGGFSILCRDECEIYLAQKEREVDLRNQTARSMGDGFAAYDLHIHCAPATIDTLWAEYRAAGVPMPSCFDGGPISRDYGIRDFSVIDPDGYDIVFGAPIGGV